MERLKRTVAAASILVFGICTYVFLEGLGILRGKFENDLFSWYFFAKGIFCSITLYLLVLIIEQKSK